MFAVGHVALGYLLGRPFSRGADGSLSVALLWTLSLLPDVDLILPGLLHRGPSHSLLTAIALSSVFLLKSPRRALPYVAALISHGVGDYVTKGGVMLLWPVSSSSLEYAYALRMPSVPETYVELALMAVLLAALFITHDLKSLLSSDVRNRLLFVPLCTVILPLLLRYPMSIPLALFPPHLVLLGIIMYSLYKSLFTRRPETKRPRVT